jgi:hypothetical protein
VSELFAYISSKTTADPYIPPVSLDIRKLSRDVSDAFVALSGGYRMVGQVTFFPLQRSVPGHLLCDGKEVAKASFPELYSFLGDTQGTPVDPDNFLLPNLIGAASFVPAAASEPETVEDGTVTSPPPTDPSIPAWNEDIYEDTDSGGKPRKNSGI